ncbi:1,4-dihydroxy-2-naphthoate octaprenyltransferase [bacterium]|nr:1,4-dihydroxy-2-naphthoate octaprenyltransferase [bacterium]
MTNFKVWISSFRLRTLPLSISGIILGSALAYSNQYFNNTIFVFALLTTISLQILSNLANDYGDGVKGTDNNNRIGPERAIQSGLISSIQMKYAIITNVLILIVLITTLLYFSFGTNEYLNLLTFFTLGIISIYSAIKYTVGNKAYGYYALGDLFVLLFFGFLSVMGSYYLYAKNLEISIILPSFSIGLLSVAVINLNNMRDLVSDKLSNKITVAGKLGFANSKKYHFLILISSIVFSLLFILFFYYKPLSLIVIISYIPIVLHLKKVYTITKPVEYNDELKKVAISTFLFSVIHSLIIII